MSVWEGDLSSVELLIMTRALKHGLTEGQIEHAWRNAVDFIRIDSDTNEGYDIKAIGFDASGRGIEISARAKSFGMIVYHANTPPSARALREFGIEREDRTCQWFRTRAL